MKLLEGPHAAWPRPERGSAVTIGVYDGVHRGHQEVIRGLIRAAAENDLAATVVTFRQHPSEVLAPDRVPPQLTTLDQRCALFAALGVDQVALLDFDEALRRRSPQDFVREILVEGVDARIVSVGEGFRFGHRQAGDLEMLAELGVAHGFDVVPMPLLGGSEPFSATRIRQALATGDLGVVATQLGRRFTVCGTVVEGDGRGRTIGVPTANLALVRHQALPAFGVYAVRAHVGGNDHPAVANVGVRPTFGGSQPVLEVHVLDLDLDLYGSSVCVEFVSRIRPERAFGGVDELLSQIRKDIAAARAAL